LADDDDDNNGKRKLGVLVHGAGWVSGPHIKAFMHNPHTKVVAISSRKRASAQARADEAGLKDAKVYDDFDKALENPEVDIVSICTPQHVHMENVVAAAKAGKHMVIEKPVANTLAEMKKERDAVRKAKVRTVVSFVLRWNPLFENIKAMIADGALGKVYAVETDYQHQMGSYYHSYIDTATAKGGVSAFHVGGCHALDAMRWFAGHKQFEAADPIEVFGYRGGWRKGKSIEYNPYEFRWQKSSAGPLQYDDFEIAMVKFSNGAVGKTAVHFGSVMPYMFPIQIFGDRGTIKDNRIWSPNKFPGAREWVSIPTVMPDTADVKHHPFQGEMDHFVDCILEGRESHCNLEDAVKTHEIFFGVEKSYETGRPVRLPLLS
jgi:predicted dehydrogenase